MIIRFLVIQKIFYLYRLNSWCNLLGAVRIIQSVMGMKFDSNKVICPEFGMNVLNGCRDDHDDLTMVDPYMNLMPCQLQEITFMSVFLSLILPNLDPLLYKKLRASVTFT